MPEKPKCPEHPKAGVLRARTKGNHSVWVCLRCGKSLGDAGYMSEPEWEESIIGDEEEG